MQEYTASEMLIKSQQRQNQVVMEMKTAIMDAILLAATKYGKTSCEIDEDLLDPITRSWLTNAPLNYQIKNGNVVDWSGH